MSGYTYQKRFNPDAGPNGKIIHERAKLPGVFTWQNEVIMVQLDYATNEYGLCQRLKVYTKVDSDLNDNPIWQDVDKVKSRHEIAETLHYITKLFIFKALGWPDREEMKASLEWQEISEPSAADSK